MAAALGIAHPLVHFGGPDRPPRLLRDLLEERIEAVPPGGAIDWMTYYFRDRQLAEALAWAHRRGVRVRLCLEGNPRRRHANDRVIARLSDPADGLGSGLSVVRHRLPRHLHTKLYCFSHPRPVALVGSFNPSGDEPEDAAVTADIGDQDRGHNLLVELSDPALVGALAAQVAVLQSTGRSIETPAVTAATIASAHMEAVFFPNRGPNALVERLGALDGGDSLRIAASHVGDPFIARLLARLVRRGVDIQLLTGDAIRTRRSTENRLRNSGVKVRRFIDPHGYPMHAKFTLAESRGARWSEFGSYNLTLTSRWLNHELLMFSDDAALWDQLDHRWNEILGDKS